MPPLDRRHFLRLLALQAAAWSLSCGRHEGGARARRAAALPANPHAGRWLGDDFSLGHRVRDGLHPAWSGGALDLASDVVVVGAGISGLTTACELAKAGRRVTLVEQAPETGGNSKSARWGGIEYSIGAAYFTQPGEGTRLERLYKELGVLARAKKVGHGEVFAQGELVHDFWGGSTARGAAVEATKKVAEIFRRIYDERYPEIPWNPRTQGWTREQFEHADRTPFASFLDGVAAPPDVRAFCEYYCWSSFGGTAEEISSYAGLNFITAEFGEILALPGGNAGIARALGDLARARGVRIVTGTAAGEVREVRGGIEVAALREDGVRRYPGKACVLAVPRFMAARLLPGFPEGRKAIVAGMKWRAYIVANVLLARRPNPEWYDAYRIEPLVAESAGWTDLVVADFVADERQDYCALTAYRALPFDAGRASVFADDTYAAHREAVRRDLLPWLDCVGLEERDIVDINLARWGHPLVLAQPGQLASGNLEKLSAPLGRVVFAHQDRYGVPAIENAIAAAFAAGDEVDRMDWVATRVR